MGLNIAHPDFRRELKAVVRDFAPQLFVIDPWNALARDAMEKDYQEAFDRLREVLAESSEPTACLIVHHLRKPKSEDRHRGPNWGICSRVGDCQGTKKRRCTLARVGAAQTRCG
jgi:hypothetical protein